jgi:hypothetical protein
MFMMFLEHLDEGIEVSIEGLGFGDGEAADLRFHFLLLF